MSNTSVIRDGCVLVTVHGEVDIATEARLVEAARDALAASAGHPVILDLSRLTFLSSSGFGHLVTLHKQAAAFGVPLRIVVGDAWAVFRPFAVMGLHDVLAVFRTTEAAIDADTDSAPS